MKDWPLPLLKFRKSLSPRNKHWEPYSSFIRKYIEGIVHPIACLEIGGFNGSLSVLLMKYRKVAGDFFVNVDVSRSGLSECKKEGLIECIRADA